MSNIFKVNNNDTRTKSGNSIVNFEHILHFILLSVLYFALYSTVSIADFEQISTILISTNNKFVGNKKLYISGLEFHWTIGRDFTPNLLMRPQATYS